jgi:methionyl-tRNA synthetase
MNRFIDEKKPWLMAKDAGQRPLEEVIYDLLEGCRQVAWGIRPFMPRVSDEMFRQLGIADEPRERGWQEARAWSGMPKGGKISKGKPIFPRLEDNP